MYPISQEQDRSGNPLRRGLRGQLPTILVVEDDPEVARLVRLELAMGGYAVVVASSVREARERLRAGIPLDLILSDIHLSGESGLKLLFPENPKVKHPPVLMMADFASPELRQLIESTGAAVLERPFSFGRLHASVIRALMRGVLGNWTRGAQ